MKNVLQWQSVMAINTVEILSLLGVESQAQGKLLIRQ